jgi:ATP-binding cassette, subfamily B, multidrug efflux pump
MLSSFRRLLPYALRYRRAYVVGLVCSLASTAVSLVSPWILKIAIDDLTVGVTQRKLATYALAVLVLAGASALLRYWVRQVVIGASRLIEYDLRNDFFAHLQRLSASYFQRTRTGDLMSRATNDLSAVRMMIGPAFMYSTSTIALFIVAMILMFSLNVKLTLISLVTMPLVSLSVRYFGSAIHWRFERIQAQLSEVSAVAQEALAGVRVVRAYGQESAELQRFQAANEEYVARNRALIALQGMLYPSMSFFLGIGALLVLWVGSREVIAGRLSLGSFFAFNSYLAMLSWPMIAFGWVTNLLQRGMASWMRMLEVLDTRPDVHDADVTVVPSGPLSAAIEFRHLTFAYGDHVVLRDVNVRVEPGRTLAIVGPTGSGKSTLIHLLPRLVDPPRGTVFIDGIDVLDLPLHVLRGTIGLVPQEPFLFSDTLGGNIAFGRPGDPLVAPLEAEVERAASIARLDKDVIEFPAGYATLVGERGLTLSGGQKQRTALARALATDPAILVLDDALSAVDTYTEEEILGRLRGVMRARTSIIVSHRVSTVQDADLIIVLEGGAIVERGTHAELVARGGFYAELHRKQLLEEELEAAG